MPPITPIDSPLAAGRGSPRGRLAPRTSAARASADRRGEPRPSAVRLSEAGRPDAGRREARRPRRSLGQHDGRRGGSSPAHRWPPGPPGPSSSAPPLRDPDGQVQRRRALASSGVVAPLQRAGLASASFFSFCELRAPLPASSPLRAWPPSASFAALCGFDRFADAAFSSAHPCGSDRCERSTRRDRAPRRRILRVERLSGC